jgi:uncharacterized repeat protein (TIGR03803 family)
VGKKPYGKSQMKPVIINATFLVAALLATFTGQAQTYTNLFPFDPFGYDGTDQQETNTDGNQIWESLLLSSNFLYGTAFLGGTNGYGTVFKLKTDGSDFTVLHTFSALPGDAATNSDGINPRSSLVMSSNVLYGTTSGGGPRGLGTIFAVNTEGTGFTNLYVFGSVYPDGYYPEAGLTLSGNTLYGTTSQSLTGNGAVFKINTDGSDYTNLFTFSIGGIDYDNNYVLTNTDGGQPDGVLALAGDTLYGTTSGGGTNGFGTLFRVNTDGSDFTNLHQFAISYSSFNTPITNSDGVNPQAGMIVSGNALYGTTETGGSNSLGTIFRINTDGTGFTNLYFFSNPPPNQNSNTDGGNPYSSLVMSGSTLYGTTSEYGSGYYGTVFSLSTNGTGFTVLYSFRVSNNAEGSLAGLALAGNTLYGTTTGGGSGNEGTVYALTLPFSVPIPLNVQASGVTLVLSWTNSAFSLQSTPFLGGSFTNVSGAASPYTVPLTNPQQFYRLQAN